MENLLPFETVARAGVAPFASQKENIQELLQDKKTAPARGGYIVPGPGRRGARAQEARKSSGFRVKFWYRTITP